MRGMRGPKGKNLLYKFKDFGSAHPTPCRQFVPNVVAEGGEGAVHFHVPVLLETKPVTRIEFDPKLRVKAAQSRDHFTIPQPR